MKYAELYYYSCVIQCANSYARSMHFFIRRWISTLVTSFKIINSNAHVTAAVRMLLNKALSAVGVDVVKLDGKSWEVQAGTETTHGAD